MQYVVWKHCGHIYTLGMDQAEEMAQWVRVFALQA